MMWKDWLIAPPATYLAVVVSFVIVYLAIILFTRISGLRSFSKMSAPDFAMTVAVGSLFASSITSDTPPLSIAVLALGCLFIGQWSFAAFRRCVPSASSLIENAPVLLMEDGRFIDENLRATNVTRADLRAKLREANVLQFDQARAVVFETTGDISVMHTADPEQQIDPDLLSDVRRNSKA